MRTRHGWIVVVLLAVLFGAGCSEDWCKHEASAMAMVSAVMPTLHMLAPDKASVLSTSLETAHSGVLAVGCDGDKKTLGERVGRVAELAVSALTLYGQLRHRSLDVPVITEAERLQAISDLTRLQAGIAREIER